MGCGKVSGLMRTARLAATLLVLSAPLALAGEEPCALEPSALKPQFVAKLPKGFKLASLKKEKQRITERLKLPDGTEVTSVAGGCAHYAVSYAIKTKTLTTKTVAAELVATARRVLPQLPLVKSEELVRGYLLKALDEASITGLPAQLPCGDATCQLSLVPVEDQKPAKKKPAKPAEGEKAEATEERPAQLVLSYDFPL